MTTQQAIDAINDIIEILYQVNARYKEEADKIARHNNPRAEHYQEYAHLCYLRGEVSRAITIMIYLKECYTKLWAREVVNGSKQASGTIYSRTTKICSAPDALITKAERLKALNSALQGVRL